ncbi:transglycosylase SLT domain-containing protein [Devosia sp.]|uniref:transglycosylase SLT domain-containing protein n=1 Tax=Devosia sp. TaxID=1871048 RepID=UPI00260DBA0E|nr:transglycosylase SLT domain-containing protein [Devosia sp.]
MKPISVPQPLAYAFDTAGAKSDVDFDYLLQTAIRESSLNPEAKAPTSSATGLFQFLDSTWLQVMKEEGPRLGYGQYADAIKVDSDGDYFIADKALRKEVLKLREDPQIASDMAAAFTRSNGAYLFEKFGRMPSPGELYIAHFLGAQGAAKLFDAGLKDPDQIAADLFPRQAKANRAIFYENGHARTIREVYRALVGKHEVAADPRFTAQQLAADPVAGKWDATPIPSRFSPDDMSFTSLFSNEGQVQSRTLMSPVSEAQGTALFTRLYGQDKPLP